MQAHPSVTIRLSSSPDPIDLNKNMDADDLGKEITAPLCSPKIRPADGQRLREWCRKRLAGFKCPSKIDFITEDQMPRTATGKILHRVLRQRHMTN